MAGQTRRRFLKGAGAAIGSVLFGRWLEAAQKKKKLQPETNAKIAKQVEVHLEVGCADGREVGEVFNRAQKEVAEKSEAAGILLDFQRISIAGAYCYPGLVREVKKLVMEKNVEYRKKFGNAEVRYFIHMKSHGDVSAMPGHENNFALSSVKFNPESPVNCGMIGGGGLASAVEREILAVKPTVFYGGKEYVLDSEKAMSNLNKEAYGTSRLLAGIVEGFEEPAKHIRTQKGLLRDAIDADHFLKSHDIEITAGVHNYNNYGYVRVDGMKGLYTAEDAVHERAAQIFSELDNSSPQVTQRVGKQDPTIILFHHMGIEQPRRQALEAMKQDESLAGRVFASSTTVVDPHEPMAIPKILGIYYAAVNYDRARTLMVMGRNEQEAQELKVRLWNDPYYQAITRVLEKRNIKLKMVLAVSGPKAIPVNGARRAGDRATLLSFLGK